MKHSVPSLIMTGIIVAILSTTIPHVFAADINCANVTPLCLGTTGDDRMAGDNSPNKIDGNQGNDQISGGGAKDFICGSAGDDKISGGDGFDVIVGDRDLTGDCTSTGGSTGADIISGGADGDVIFHGDFNGVLADEIKSDGHRDIIDCGAGNDIAVINISVDHDVATNCETVNAG